MLYKSLYRTTFARSISALKQHSYAQLSFLYILLQGNQLSLQLLELHFVAQVPIFFLEVDALYLTQLQPFLPAFNFF